jgi:hypothetical protein
MDLAPAASAPAAAVQAPSSAHRRCLLGLRALSVFMILFEVWALVWMLVYAFYDHKLDADSKAGDLISMERHAAIVDVAGRYLSLSALYCQKDIARSAIGRAGVFRGIARSTRIKRLREAGDLKGAQRLMGPHLAAEAADFGRQSFLYAGAKLDEAQLFEAGGRGREAVLSYRAAATVTRSDPTAPRLMSAVLARFGARSAEKHGLAKDARELWTMVLAEATPEEAAKSPGAAKLRADALAALR